jgi:hypothetical protein
LAFLTKSDQKLISQQISIVLFLNKKGLLITLVKKEKRGQKKKGQRILFRLIIPAYHQSPDLSKAFGLGVKFRD